LELVVNSLDSMEVIFNDLFNCLPDLTTVVESNPFYSDLANCIGLWYKEHKVSYESVFLPASDTRQSESNMNDLKSNVVRLAISANYLNSVLSQGKLIKKYEKCEYSYKRDIS